MRQWLQIIKETVPGTTPAATGTNSIWLDMEENDPAINLVPTMFTIKSALPKRGVTARITGSSQDTANGSIQTALYHEQAQFWKDVVFEPTLGASPYFVPSLPTVTINRGWLDNSGNVRYEQYKRCSFTSFSLSGSNQGSAAPIRLSLNLIGGEYNGGATIAPPSCSAFPTSVYLWSMADFKLNNVSLKSVVLSLSVQATHGVTPVYHMNRYPDRYTYTGWTPSVTVAMDMDSHTYRTKYLDIRTAFASATYATNNNVELTYAADKKVKFDLYNAMFSELNPQRPPGGDHSQNGTIVPYYDCTNLDMTCTITNPA